MKVRMLQFHLFLLLASSLLSSVQSYLPSSCIRSATDQRQTAPSTIATQQQTKQRRYLSIGNGDDDNIINKNNDKKNTFSFAQRIESTKSGIVGLLTGGIALAPISVVHNLLFAYDGSIRTVTHNLAQFEFDTDAGSLEAALFAIVYRYCLRQGDDDNPQLNQGVIGAFALTRTLSKIQVPGYCMAVPLNCTYMTNNVSMLLHVYLRVCVYLCAQILAHCYHWFLEIRRLVQVELPWDTWIGPSSNKAPYRDLKV